jgi:micrococcal nuclease
MKKVIFALLMSSCYSESDFSNSSSNLANKRVSDNQTSDLSKVNNEEVDEEVQEQENAIDDLEELTELKSKVVAIQDGDTIELRLVLNNKKARDRNGKNLRIRFAHIDTPERGQPFYKVAKNFTSDHCFGTIVSIIHNNEFDKYGRLIGEVILSNGENLNKLLVLNGMAVHFKKYSDSEEYAKMEIEAQNEKLGIWE